MMHGVRRDLHQKLVREVYGLRVYIPFVFSSRRWHTRCLSDWSSDVCSSDLYAVVATAGSTIGAYLTFRLARKAGEAYLDSKFGQARVSAFLGLFKKWGTGTLVASSAIPFPFPTSLVFAAAGASEYPLGRYLTVVTLSRAVRYVGLALLVDH